MPPFWVPSCSGRLLTLPVEAVVVPGACCALDVDRSRAMKVALNSATLSPSANSNRDPPGGLERITSAPSCGPCQGLAAAGDDLRDGTSLEREAVLCLIAVDDLELDRRPVGDDVIARSPGRVLRSQHRGDAAFQGGRGRLRLRLDQLPAGLSWTVPTTVVAGGERAPRQGEHEAGKRREEQGAATPQHLDAPLLGDGANSVGNSRPECVIPGSWGHAGTFSRIWRRRARPRYSRDSTVPRGVPITSAASSQDRPSSSTSTMAVRKVSGSWASARRSSSRSSWRSTSSSGSGIWPGTRASWSKSSSSTVRQVIRLRWR